MVDAPRRPMSLDDVRVGDEVVIDISWSVHTDGYLATVERLTATQIVIPHDGGLHDRFDRRTGRRIGASGYRGVPTIVTGKHAFRVMLKICSVQAADLATKANAGLRQSDVLRLRAICDEAEQALRVLGEWKDTN